MIFGANVLRFYPKAEIFFCYFQSGNRMCSSIPISDALSAEKQKGFCSDGNGGQGLV